MNELLLVIHMALVTGACVIACKKSKAALISIVTLCCILANLFVTKHITLFGLSATGSDALAIGAFLGTNLLQEYYGKSAAQEAIVVSSCAGIFYMLMSIIHLSYAPSAADTNSLYFYALLSPMPRLIIASFVSYFLVQQFSVRFAQHIKHVLPSANFVLRNYFCLATDQLLDTLIFSFFGLYGIIAHLGHVIIISYMLKMVGVLITSFTLYTTQSLLTKNTHESSL